MDKHNAFVDNTSNHSFVNCVNFKSINFSILTKEIAFCLKLNGVQDVIYKTKDEHNSLKEKFFNGYFIHYSTYTRWLDGQTTKFIGTENMLKILSQVFNTNNLDIWISKVKQPELLKILLQIFGTNSNQHINTKTANNNLDIFHYYIIYLTSGKNPKNIDKIIAEISALKYLFSVQKSKLKESLPIPNEIYFAYKKFAMNHLELLIKLNLVVINNNKCKCIDIGSTSDIDLHTNISVLKKLKEEIEQFNSINNFFKHLIFELNQEDYNNLKKDLKKIQEKYSKKLNKAEENSNSSKSYVFSFAAWELDFSNYFENKQEVLVTEKTQ